MRLHKTLPSKYFRKIEMEIVSMKRAFTELGEMFPKTRDDIGAFTCLFTQNIFLIVTCLVPPR